MPTATPPRAPVRAARPSNPPPGAIDGARPIACSLAPDKMRDRVAFIDSLAADALIGQDEIEGGVRSRFRGSPEVERRVRELVEAESICCGFLSFDVSRRAGEVWVEITGAPEARPVIDQFFAA